MPSYPAPRRLRVLPIAGANRRKHNCPGTDSKARTLLNGLDDRLPAIWDIDTEELSNVYGRPKIQSCKACFDPVQGLFENMRNA